ncbi:MAG: hypothetical protein ABH859_06525 [Pseudomonadota bacterium]
MKNILCIISLIFVISASSCVLAGPPCPRSSLNLADYAACTVPIVGSKGRVIGRVASAGQMDSHTASLMNAMNTTTGVPPQPYPIMPVATSLASNMAVAYSIYHHGKYMPYFPYMPSMPYGFWISVPLYR